MYYSYIKNIFHLRENNPVNLENLVNLGFFLGIYGCAAFGYRIRMARIRYTKQTD